VGVVSRIVGRLITGPIAFAIAGIADIVLYTLQSLGARVKQRW
jgi:hypothetical protein